MELRELSPSLLESLVDVVATLGELVATVAGPDGDVLLAVSPNSLHKALETFIDHLQATLGHGEDTALGESLATLGATPEDTWEHEKSVASAWRASVAELRDKWSQRAKEATELHKDCGDVAASEVATTVQARELQDKKSEWEKATNNLKATASEPQVATSKEKATLALEAFNDKVGKVAEDATRAKKDMQDTVVTTNQAKAATKRRQRAEVALGPLQRLVAACDKATAMVQELWCHLGDIEATLVGTKGAAIDVPEALEAKRLWEASADLAKYHLLDTLDVTRGLLPSGRGGPEVAARCQKAREDIPGLLRGE